MSKTAQEIAKLHPQEGEREKWLSDPETPIRSLLEYIFIIRYINYDHKQTEQRLAKTALDVRISNDASKSAEKLSKQTDRLIEHLENIRSISEEQKKLAAKLEGQTNKIICLTWALLIFSVALLAMAFVQTAIMFKENAQTHDKQVETTQTNQAASANK